MDIVKRGDTYVVVVNQDEIEDIRRALSVELDRRETDFWNVNEIRSTDSVTVERIRERYLRAERNYVTVSQSIRGNK
jgi:hypothetical protein